MDWSARRGCRAGCVAFVVAVVMSFAGCGGDDEPPPPPQLRICQQTCQSADDCGDPGNWICDEGFCRIAPMASGRCQHDRECWATFSGWRQTDCRDEACLRGDTCILVGNITYCAPQAPVRGSCPVGTPYEAELADGSGRVAVCANQQALCKEGTCRDPCNSDADCGHDRTCNSETGECLCTKNSDCTGPLVCDQVSGECICKNNADCTRDGYGTCYDGSCGCANDGACVGLGNDYACAAVSNRE